MPYSREYGYNLTLYSLCKILESLFGDINLIVVHNEDKPSSNMFDAFGHVPYEKYSIYDVNHINDLKNMDSRCEHYVHYIDNFDLKNNYDIIEYYSILQDKLLCIFPTEFGKKKGNQYIQSLIHCGNMIKKFEDTESNIAIKEVNLFDMINPILFCDKNYFSIMCSMGRMRLPDKYLACYVECLDDEKLKKINSIADSNELILNLIYDKSKSQKGTTRKNINIIENCLLEEWIANFAYSEYVITDSYYGVCLALIYEKPFLILNTDIKQELKTLLKILNINVEIPGNCYDENWNMIYNIITEKLKEYRKNVIECLKSLIYKGMNAECIKKKD